MLSSYSPSADEADQRFGAVGVDLPELQVADLHQGDRLGRLALGAQDVARLQRPRGSSRQQLALLILGQAVQEQRHHHHFTGFVHNGLMADSQARDLPDLTAGIPLSRFTDDAAIEGKVGDDEVAIVKSGGRFFAVGARCTHYRGHLADGLVVGQTIRCPLHHACFSLETGEALRAPALDPIACWKVEQRDGKVFVREKLAKTPAPVPAMKQNPASVVIVGGGAAGLAAADMLRREGYSNPVTIISSDQDAPVDRPNLSKDYLAGEAQDDWIPMWPPELYEERHVELVLGTRVSSIDPAARTISLDNGTRREYGALLLATGADPVHLPVPGNNKDQILYLRTFADSRAIVERTKGASRVVVVGASFIGLEVSASLRTRGINVEVVAPDSVPLERVMGGEIGASSRGFTKVTASSSISGRRWHRSMAARSG